MINSLVVTNSELLLENRLDAHYYNSPGYIGTRLLNSSKGKKIDYWDLGGDVEPIDIPSLPRSTLIYAAEEEEGIPYLRPYDVFEYLPTSTNKISMLRMKHIDKYMIKHGDILQTCSGRNLGPLTMVDGYLSDFIIGSDMLRIRVEDPIKRFYLLAFLRTDIGQGLLKWGKTGSVIDHLSAAHILNFSIPLIDTEQIAKSMKKAFDSRESGRLMLRNSIQNLESKLPPINVLNISNLGWSTTLAELENRIDAAFYEPTVLKTRKALIDSGGMPLKDIAKVIKPKGRYKTAYVDKGYGKPILSGTQLLQHQPINLRYIANRSFKDPSEYELKHKFIAYQADGRVEKGLGTPSFITSSRKGWLASGHVGRVVANEGISSGALYLALRTKQCQIQIKAMASGSVVDSTFVPDMENVIIPSLNEINGEEIEQAWSLLDSADQIEFDAIRLLDEKIRLMLE